MFGNRKRKKYSALEYGIGMGWDDPEITGYAFRSPGSGLLIWNSMVSWDTPCLIGDISRGNYGGLAVVPGIVRGGAVKGCPAHAEDDHDYLHVSSLWLWLARLENGGQMRRGGKRITPTERNCVEYWMKATAPRPRRECSPCLVVSWPIYNLGCLLRVLGGRTRRVST